MIMTKNDDGTYSQVGFIKDNSGADMEYIKDKDGVILFEKGFTREKSGALPLQLEGIGKPLKDYDIEGNIYQSDGVTSDTPQEVKAVGDKTANLINANAIVKGRLDDGVLGYEEETTELIVSGNVIKCTTAKAWRGFVTDFIPVGQGGYFLYHIATPNDITYAYRISVYDPQKNFVRVTAQSERTITINEGEAFIRVSYQLGVAGTFEISNIMFSKSKTALPYEPYGYKLDVVSRGKNLFDIRTITENAYLNGGTGLTGDSQYSDTSDFIMVIGEKITISATLSGDLLGTGTRDICFYNSSKVLMKSLTLQSDLSQSVTIAVPEGAAYVRLAYDKSCTNIQLELGSTATSYEPYTPPITTPIYLDSPLYEIGDYSDSRGMTEEVRVVKELVLTGEETVNIFSNAPIAFSIRASGMLRSERKGICTHFAYQYSPGQSVKDGVTFGDLLYFTLSSETASRFGIIAQDTSSFKAYLAAQYANGTPVKVYYVLATPETKTVEPVEIPTLDGTTIIEAETTVQPSEMQIKYKSRI